MKPQTKNNIEFIGSMMTLTAGTALFFIGLCIPPKGVIDGSVLAAGGELLTFTGAVWGISYKYRVNVQNIKQEVREEIEKEKQNETTAQYE